MDSAIQIIFAGETFLADTRRVLYWPARATLVVADLHIGKAFDYTSRATLLPPYEVQDICDRLAKVVEDYRPQRVICLGDSFHRASSFQNLHDSERGCLEALTKSGPQWVFVEGNHDADITESEWKLLDEVPETRLDFRHQPIRQEKPQIVGHFHPKFRRLVNQRNMISKPCFAWDENLFIMPAFGTYAGGLDVTDKAIASQFRGAVMIATADTKPRPAKFPLKPACEAQAG